MPPPPTPVIGLGTSPLEELGGFTSPHSSRRRGWRQHSRLPVPTPKEQAAPERAAQNCSGRPAWGGRTSWGGRLGLRLDHRKPLWPLFIHSSIELEERWLYSGGLGKEGPDPQGDPPYPEIKTEAQTLGPRGLHESSDARCSGALALALIPTSGHLWQTGFSRGDMRQGGAWGSCTSCLRASSECVQKLADGKEYPPHIPISPRPPPPAPRSLLIETGLCFPPQTWPSLLAVLCSGAIGMWGQEKCKG